VTDAFDLTTDGTNFTPGRRKNNFAASVAPGVSDDTDSDYEVGSVWVDTTADTAYVCVDSSSGAAVWDEIGSGGDVATDAIWDAKGDLAVGTGADTAARLAVGSDGQAIGADSSRSSGIRWGAFPTIVMTDGITDPPEPVWNEDGDDYVYTDL
jgi:hypothetical protein